MFRVAITTAEDRASRLSDMARGHGLEPVSLPCIDVIPAPEDQLSGARSQAAEADWLVVTSSRAIDTLWPGGGMPDVPVAVVGSSTAEVAVRAGGRVAVVGDGGAEDLVEELAGHVGGKSVFFPHASGADPATLYRLGEAGAEVAASAVYETRPIGPGADPVDAAIFGSPSAVSGWCRSRSLGDLVLAAIGKATGAALVERGHHPDVVPPHPDFELLISLLAAHLAERSPV